jgi:hypothetical protein
MPAMPIRSLRGALVAALAVLCTAAVAAPAAHADTTSDPLTGTGMWIWQIPNTERGDAVKIGARAKKNHIDFVVVKAAHGATPFPGYTADFVAALHAQGLKVCAYQRVLSTGGAAQARLLAAQTQLGADCAVIDAESELEGRYSVATAYMKTLRAALGTSFPIALTSFPWIGYHPEFPYSVFLGKGGAQYNLPQIYWKAIGVSVATAFANTYPANSVYGRPIRPIGQLYENPPVSQILQFRTLAAQYGAKGVSYWVWEQASTAGFAAVGSELITPALQKVVVPPTLTGGSRGDLVRWARLRLKTRRQAVAIGSGVYDSALRAVVLRYQAEQSLPLTGNVDPATWGKLMPVYQAAR